MLYRCLFSAFVISQLLMADTNVGWSETGGDKQQEVGGALILDKGDDQTAEPIPFYLLLKASKQLHNRSSDCVSAKLDLWIHDGQIEYIVFAPHAPSKDAVNSAEPSHLTFGRPKCRIHVKLSAD
jgi:hypothetical protein